MIYCRCLFSLQEHTVKNKHKNSYLNAKFEIMVLVQIISINKIGKFTCSLE